MSCCICKESLNDNIKSYATGCGHVFHDPCLSKWREQQNACPQCRRNLNVEPIRLYLNLADDGNYEDCDNQGEKEDIDALKVKLESLRKEIQEKQIKYENLERKLEKNKELCVNFKERFLALQVKYDVMKRTMKEIKSEIREMKDLHGAKEELQRTLKNLEEKLLVLNG